MPKIVMQGPLTKQGAQVKNWKLRWFTLDSHSVLKYYGEQVCATLESIEGSRPWETPVALYQVLSKVVDLEARAPYGMNEAGSNSRATTALRH